MVKLHPQNMTSNHEQHATSGTNASFSYSFPAIRGIQAGREYYVSMCPVRLIPKIFLFTSAELPADLRAQRRLNHSRLPHITDYIVRNSDNYVLSAITASIDGEVQFIPLPEDTAESKLGTLIVNMDAKFIINDGQHRRAAIEKALEERPEIGNETISVVFFLDPDLKRCQQMFADLNRHAIRPSPSLGILYDHRDTKALLTKRLMSDSDIFRDLVETERSNLSARSRRLFTLSAIYGATNELLAGMEDKNPDELAILAGKFWESLAKIFKEWNHVHSGKMSASEVRQDFIHSHSVVLAALARAGNALLLLNPKDWKKQLGRLSRIDWRRSNNEWEGRAMIGGRISKAQNNVLLVTNKIKKCLKIPLSAEESHAEEAFMRAE